VEAQPSFPPHVMPDVPQGFQVLTGLVSRKYPFAFTFALLSQVLDQLDSWRTERKLVRLALLGVRRWLNPVAELFIELRPLGFHSLGRATAGEHDDTNAVSCDPRVGR